MQFITPNSIEKESAHSYTPKKHLHQQTKEIVYRVYTFFKKEANDIPVFKNYLQRTIDAVDISKATICRIVQEFNENGFESLACDNQNETKDNFCQEIHHLTPKKHLQLQTKEMIYKVYDFFMNEAVELSEKPEFKNFLKRTIRAVGISKPTICRIVQEMNKNGQISVSKRIPKKPKSSFRIRFKKKEKSNKKGETRHKIKKEEVFEDMPISESITVPDASGVTRPWI